MSGLPRAGNTLLSSILNQNPKINATANSVLPEIMFRIHDVKSQDIVYNNFPDEASVDNVLKNLFDAYYKDWDGDFIIERGAWITPYNFTLLENYFGDDIKIVILVRDVLDVIKSYLNLCAKDPNFYINVGYNKLDHATLYLSEIEEKCELIMKKGDLLDTMLYSIKWLLDNKKNSLLHFVDYKDLIKDTEKEIKGIYKFFNMDYYHHHFTNLEQFSINNVKYDDNAYGASIDMHKIRTGKIKSLTHSIELPKSVVNKYSGLGLWS